MQVKVSVIVPVYNTEAYLPACLDSVLSQTLQQIEVICINDGSPDHSLELLRKYEERDGRVRVIDKRNEGVGAARNDGIRAATGEYIAFMDSDDYYPNHETLAALYEAAVVNHVQICGGYYQKIFADGKVEDARPGYRQLPLDCKGLTHYSNFQYDYGYTGYIFSRDLLIENQIFFPRYGRFQDPPFFVQAMIAAGTFYALDEPTYCYRMVPGTGKTSFPKTCDMLCGIRDNLEVSRKYGLAKLHYITACRLNEEGSYMAIGNLYHGRRKELLAQLIQLNALVDTSWLKEEGYALPEPFVLDVFTHAVNTAEMYEKMRCGKLRRALTWLPRRLCR